MREVITIEDAILMLNSMIMCDEEAVLSLVSDRVKCNEAMANHPSIQVAGGSGVYFIGLLGVINGLFGVSDSGQGPIALMTFDGKPLFFSRDGG